jgi:hypothetical protein
VADVLSAVSLGVHLSLRLMPNLADIQKMETAPRLSQPFLLLYLILMRLNLDDEEVAEYLHQAHEFLGSAKICGENNGASPTRRNRAESCHFLGVPAQECIADESD